MVCFRIKEGNRMDPYTYGFCRIKHTMQNRYYGILRILLRLSLPGHSRYIPVQNLLLMYLHPECLLIPLEYPVLIFFPHMFFKIIKISCSIFLFYDIEGDGIFCQIKIKNYRIYSILGLIHVG